MRRVIFGELLSLSTSQLVALELYQQLVADRLAQTLKYHSFLDHYSFDMNLSHNGNMYASRNRYKRRSYDLPTYLQVCLICQWRVARLSNSFVSRCSQGGSEMKILIEAEKGDELYLSFLHHCE